jgi:soluble lytic murein transglycosylase-like protein
MRIPATTAVAAVAAVLLVVPPAAVAESRDFTFRRVTPPAPGATRRITVQIDPEEQAALLAARPALPPAPDHPPPAPPGTGAADPPGALAWYWELVSPALADASAGRLEAAVARLASGPGGASVPAPRLQTLQAIASAHGTEILRATVGTRVSPAFVLAVIAIESGGRTDAVSPKGATGLMQLMPATAERFGVADSADPAQNIRGGVAYLDLLMREFGGDPLLVLAAYNAGEGAVRAHAGVPPYAETRDYVPKVLAAWTVARGLCATPPELLSDGCVFNAQLAGL